MLIKTLFVIYFLYNLENQIDGLAFIDLSENDIRQMIKPIGCVLKILRLKSSVSVSSLMLF